MYKTDISAQLGALKLKNPVMPASGAYDYFENNAGVFPLSELGAVVLKSVHRLERKGNPAPRIVEVLGGMINAVGIPSRGIEHFLAHELQTYRNIGASIVVSLSGSEVSHYVESAELIADNQLIGALELNLSCPNVGTGLAFASDTRLLAQAVQGVRKKTRLPLLVKLSPQVSNIAENGRIAEESGADAIIASNTYRAMAVDIKTQRPVLGNIAGGLSGPAIKPMVLCLVYTLCETVNIPVIGCGGIMGWQDALEYILVGAEAVQVGSGNFVNPMLMKEVIEGLDSYLYENGYKSLSDVRGLALEGRMRRSCG